MKPAVCALCGKSAAHMKPPNTGDWVEFSDYQSPVAGSLDHPRGLEYFCDEHVGAAKPLAMKTSADALVELQSSGYENQDRTRLPWWRRLFRRVQAQAGRR